MHSNVINNFFGIFDTNIIGKLTNHYKSIMTDISTFSVCGDVLRSIVEGPWRV